MGLLQDIKAAANNWWVFIIMGAIFIILGFYIMSVPAESFVALTVLLAIGMFFDGIGDIFFSITNRTRMHGWGWHLAIGCMSALLGISLIMYPEVGMRVLPLYVGFWILLKGALLSGVAFELKRHENGYWWLVLFLGGLNGLFGILMILNPLFGATVIVVIAGLGIISIGVSLIFVAFRVRHFKSLLPQDAQVIE
ncbi:HdeD family acid-resistance protein [Roseivirga pacifica]